MSSRRGWQGTARIDTTPPTERPNLMPDYVSAHIRVYWPYTATFEDVRRALDAAHADAIQGARERYSEGRR